MSAKFNFNEMSDKLRILLFFGIAVAFVALFYFLLYLPSENRLVELRKQNDVLVGEVKELDGFLKQHPDLDAYLLETDRVMRVFNTLLPNDNNVSNVLVIIGKMAQISNVSLDTISPGQWVDKDKCQEMTITLTASGQYIDLLEFIKLLEDNPKRFTIVRSLNIAADKGPMLKATMTLLIYSWKEKNVDNRYLNG